MVFKTNNILPVLYFVSLREKLHGEINTTNHRERFVIYEVFIAGNVKATETFLMLFLNSHQKFGAGAVIFNFMFVCA
jgi:hypothetical protein